MSSTSTPTIALFKATPGTGEPFRTTDLNSNSDKIDSAVGALDTRLDAVEANNWVTSARIADGAVGASELASNAVSTVKILDANVTVGKLAASLDLSGKTVNVATQSAGDSSTKAASTAFVTSAIAAKNLPTLVKGGTSALTSSGGQLTLSLSGLGFSATPHVTANAVGAGAHYIVSIISKSSSSVVFYVTNDAGTAVSTGTSVTLSWVAVQS